MGIRAASAGVAAQLGYRPNMWAASLRTRKTTTVGVVMPRLTDGVIATTYQGIEEAAIRAGYSVLLSSPPDDLDAQRRAIDLLVGRQVDGLLLSSLHIPGRPFVEWLSAGTLPILTLTRHRSRTTVRRRRRRPRWLPRRAAPDRSRPHRRRSHCRAGPCEHRRRSGPRVLRCVRRGVDPDSPDANRAVVVRGGWRRRRGPRLPSGRGRTALRAGRTATSHRAAAAVAADPPTRSRTVWRCSCDPPVESN